MRSVAAACILLAMSSQGHGDDPTATREVLLDNPTVEVVRLTYPAGSESGLHSHAYPHRVAYVVKGGRLEMVPAGGETPPQTVELVEGQAVFLPAATHNIRNVGETEVVIIETEIK